MGAYRKRPVVIEARRIPEAKLPGSVPSRGEIAAIAYWCGGAVMTNVSSGEFCIDIRTLEGVMRALPGDWIIKGVQGEFYPCKADIFAATYEEVL